MPLIHVCLKHKLLYIILLDILRTNEFVSNESLIIAYLQNFNKNSHSPIHH